MERSRMIRFLALLILLTALSACSNSSSSNSPVDGDLPTGDGDSDDDQETGESSDNTENGTDGDEETEDQSLFDSNWWDAPDESGVLELMKTSPFFSQRDWLIRDMSSWFEENEHETPGDTPRDSSMLGYYSVGNGRVFGFVGSYHPRNTLHGMIGPDYQKYGDGFFSDTSAYIEIEGKLQKWKREWIWKPRTAQIPITRMQVASSPVELDTITFAVRGDVADAAKNSIIQVLNVRNTGDSTARDISLRIQTFAKAAVVGEAHIDQNRDHHQMRIAPVAEGWTVVEGDEENHEALRSSTFELKAGEERQFVIVYEFTFEGETPGEALAAVSDSGWETLMDATARWWQSWHSRGLTLRSPDVRVNDMVETLKSTVRVQIVEAGGITEMSHYTATWIRDSFGPTRMLLRFGYPEEAWGISDYYFGAASMEGAISNSIDCHYELPDVLPEVVWSANMPFGGRLRGEGPSHIPLMHTWLWRYTGISEALVDRWDYLIHTLQGQTITEDGLMMWSGDETFRPQFAMNINLGAEYTFEDLTYSAYSAFLFVRAAELLSQFGHLHEMPTNDLNWLDSTRQQVREATDSAYWLEDEGYYSAFIYMDTMEPDRHACEDGGTQPLWLGYHSSEDARARENIEGMMDKILMNDATLQNQPDDDSSLLGYSVGGGILTGMTHSYFLYNGTELNLDIADNTFDAIGAYASPSGNLPEVALFEEPRRAVSPMYARNGSIGEIWARHRAWEGGIAAEALMHHLIGFKADLIDGWVGLSPRLIHDSDWIEADNLRFGESLLAMRYERNNNGYLLTIDGPEDLSVDGLKDYRLKLIVHSDVISSLSANGELLADNSYVISHPYEGLSVIEIALAATPGRFEIAIGTEAR